MYVKATAVNTSVTMFTVTTEVRVSSPVQTPAYVCVHLALADHAAALVSNDIPSARLTWSECIRDSKYRI